MFYSNGIFYVLDKEDEIVRFDSVKHKNFEYDAHLPFDDEIKLSAEELIVGNFMWTHACEVWNQEKHEPDHSIGLVVTDNELADCLRIPEKVVRETINKLIEKEIIGIVLLPDNTYAYHFVL